MKIAVCTIAYNESKYIGACIDSWKDIVDKHLVLVSVLPWEGSVIENDTTYEIAKESGADTILSYWETEAIQRDWGLAYLHDYDYVLIVDPDEFYTKEDQHKIIDAMESRKNQWGETMAKISAFKVSKIVTYWKTPEYVFDPIDKHKPLVAVDPKQVRFYEHRQVQPKDCSARFQTQVYPIDVICHHMSWVKTDEKVREKIQSFSHRDNVYKNWYENVWLKWESGSDIMVRPYGVENSIAIKKPAPQEIIDLIEKSS